MARNQDHARRPMALHAGRTYSGLDSSSRGRFPRLELGSFAHGGLTPRGPPPILRCSRRFHQRKLVPKTRRALATPAPSGPPSATGPDSPAGTASPAGAASPTATASPTPGTRTLSAGSFVGFARDLTTLYPRLKEAGTYRLRWSSGELLSNA